jgi:hypothetical protein
MHDLLRTATFRHIAMSASVLVTGALLTVVPAVTAHATSALVPPFTQCPSIGASPSCEILLVVNADNTVTVVGDPSVGTFDGSDDTLVGIVNNSAKSVDAVTVSGPSSDLSGFDGDGICSGDYGTWNGSSGCPYGPTGYEGPGTSFVVNSSMPDSAEVDFTQGLAPGKWAYFSLEGALASAQLTAREGHLGFTVNGSIPVQPNSTQDTHDQTPNAKCNRALFNISEGIGIEAVGSFAVTRHLPASALLLAHFLNGSGTEIDFLEGSAISNQAMASSVFKALNKAVLAEMVRQLNAGSTQVNLGIPPLLTIRFGNVTSDLYWGFRGTQGLTVTGSGNLQNGNYVGSLTYVIKDSYGFPPKGDLDSYAPAMRYLQTSCGAPYHKGGAHWFPDTITVTVPFSQPAS